MHADPPKRLQVKQPQKFPPSARLLYVAMVFSPCKTGDLSLLRSILESSISPAKQLERRDASGKTPLMRAIKYGACFEIDRFLGHQCNACYLGFSSAIPSAAQVRPP